MKYRILFWLFLFSLIVSLILSLTPISEICDPGKGCEVVQHSSYASTLGIKNSHYGSVIFALALLLIISHIRKPEDYKRKIIHAIIIASSLVALYFIYIQEFILNAYCKYCMVVDISMLVAFLVIIWRWKE